MAATAAAWFHRSVLQDYAEAQFNLGLMYANGEGGLTKDTVKAVEFFRKAAIQGNAADMIDIYRDALEHDAQICCCSIRTPGSPG
jgi:TPR repeat protein